ncbi:MAG TPA: AraC family transcriptional regulator [Pyrinomonadaceae bacterium]|nr:AraC family transcriptional regulator [Pyrinomonadaceae bacterium]
MLLESLYPPGLRQPRHTHVQASFSFVLAGSYVESFGRRQQTRQPSTIIFHPPQESHSVDYGSEAVRILSVGVDFKRLDHIREHSIVLDSPSSYRTETIAWLARRIYREFGRMDAASSLAIEGLVLEILAEASRNLESASERKSPRWIERAREFLHDNFSEPLVLEDIAKSAGVHTVHLARVFRREFGCTIGEYVRRLRVEYACQKISSTELSLSEIALMAGFADQSHLTKTFRNFFGLTPSEYRKIFRKR